MTIRLSTKQALSFVVRAIEYAVETNDHLKSLERLGPAIEAAAGKLGR